MKNALFVTLLTYSLLGGLAGESARVNTQKVNGVGTGARRVGRLDGEGLARIALALESPGVLFNREGYVKPLVLNSQFLELVRAAE